MPATTEVRARPRLVELPWEEGPLLDSPAPAETRTRKPAGPVRWWDGPLASLDLETTGRDPQTDRILAIALFHQDGNQPPVPIVDTLVDPGADVIIPDGAAAVHGITRERLVEARAPALGPTLIEVQAALTSLATSGTPVVIYNAPFDWPFLAAELRRLDVAPTLPSCSLVDPLVLDRHVDRYRRGKRTLTATAEVYGVPLRDAHEAAADALASLGIARAIGCTHPAVGSLGPDALHALQVQAHAAWRDDFNDYLLRIDADRDPVIGGWPGTTH